MPRVAIIDRPRYPGGIGPSPGSVSVMAQSPPQDTSRVHPQVPDRCDLAIALGLSCAAMTAYAWTLAPGLLEADSGEFQTQAALLGLAHPTGYPVYLLLAKAATWLPVGDIAYRVNLLSAIMAALATAETYLLGRLLSGRRWIAVAGAVALAVSPTFWSQAIIAEVYTSGIALMLGVLICLELWREGRGARWLFAAACLGGVSLGVHATHALLAPAAILIVLLTPRGWKAPWTAALTGAVAGTAITLAAFWVIQHANSPTDYFRTVIYPSRSVWGLGPEQLDSGWGRIRLCFDPPQYKALVGSQPADAVRAKYDWYVANLAHEFPVGWLCFVPFGIVWLAWRNWKMTLLLASAFAVHFAYDLSYDMGDIQVLYLATYVPIVAFAVAGLALACDAAAACGAACGAGVSPAGGAGVSPAGAQPRRLHHNVDLALGLIALALVVWPLFRADAWNDEHRRDARVPPGEDPFRVEYSPTFREPIEDFRQRARLLVDALEPGAVVFTGWCHSIRTITWPTWRKAGRDLTFYQDYPHPRTFRSGRLRRGSREAGVRRSSHLLHARRRKSRRGVRAGPRRARAGHLVPGRQTEEPPAMTTPSARVAETHKVAGTLRVPSAGRGTRRVRHSPRPG